MEVQTLCSSAAFPKPTEIQTVLLLVFGAALPELRCCHGNAALLDTTATPTTQFEINIQFCPWKKNCFVVVSWTPTPKRIYMETGNEIPGGEGGGGYT